MAKTPKYGEETVTMRVPVSMVQTFKDLLDRTGKVKAAAKPKRPKKLSGPIPGTFGPDASLPKHREECYGLGYIIGRAVGITRVWYSVPFEFRDEFFYEEHARLVGLDDVPDEFRDLVAVSVLETIQVAEDEARERELLLAAEAEAKAAVNG